MPVMPTAAKHYTANLELLKGSCLICRLLSGDNMGTEAEGTVMHTIDTCRSSNKYRFFGADARVGCPSKSYMACFGCGNP